MSKQYSIFTSIYSAIDGFCDDHPERAEEFVDWLSEANPNIWEGECSGGPAVYEDFLEFLSKQDCESLSVSQSPNCISRSSTIIIPLRSALWLP